MRKLLVACVGLSLGLLGIACPGWSFEYLAQSGATSNRFFVGAGEVRTLAGPATIGIVGEIQHHEAKWTLSSELCDESCPSCSFPAFQFLDSYLCSIPGFYPSCTDGFWAIGSRLGGVFVALSDSVEVGEHISLEQDTRRDEVTCSQEGNLFLYQKTQLEGDQNPPLSQLQGLTARFYHQVKEAHHLETCPEPLGLASTMVGIKFSNPKTQQVLNYEIPSFDSRGAEFDGYFWSFQAANGETVYGMNDDLSVYGLEQLERLGRGKIFSLPVLARVRSLIQANPMGLDTDLAHWKVEGFFSGSTTHGQAFIQSTHLFLSLEGF